MNKTIYVRDEQLWEDSRLKAEREGRSLSGVIEGLLKGYMMTLDPRIERAVQVLVDMGGFSRGEALRMILEAREKAGLE